MKNTNRGQETWNFFKNVIEKQPHMLLTEAQITAVTIVARVF